jgi:hypothetical protein
MFYLLAMRLPLPTASFARLAAREDLLAKLLALVASAILVLIMFLKFGADVSSPYLQRLPEKTPMLSNYDVYWANLQDLMRPRFAGNYAVYFTAKAIEKVIGIPADIRLHPLRLAAVFWSTLGIWAAALPVMLDRSGRWNWRVFFAAYLAMACVSFYTYMPYDLPSTAFIVLGLWAILHRRPALALLAIVIGSAFRESMLHIVFFAMCTLLVPSLRVHAGWIVAMFVVFFAEWFVIRKFLFPGSGQNHFVWRIWRHLGSLTLWASVGLVAWYTAQSTLAIARRVTRVGWDDVDLFFWIQVLAVVPWLLFYTVNNGNLSEFRMLLPVLVPLVFALAYRRRPEDTAPQLSTSPERSGS